MAQRKELMPFRQRRPKNGVENSHAGFCPAWLFFLFPNRSEKNEKKAKKSKKGIDKRGKSGIIDELSRGAGVKVLEKPKKMEKVLKKVLTKAVKRGRI